MKKNLLYHQIKAHLKSIEKNLCAYSKKRKSKYLHLLRLDIKIVKALLSFAEALSKKPYNAIELQSIFKKSGELREIQIMIRLLHSSQHRPEKLIRQLKKNENFFLKQFLKNISKDIIAVKKIRKQIFVPPILADEQIIKNYFETELMKVNDIFERKDREGMHQFRKTIKKLMFIHDALPKKMQKKVKWNKRSIDELQESVGKWHDTYTFIKFLSQRYFSKKTFDYISSLKEKEEKQFNALFIN